MIKPLFLKLNRIRDHPLARGSFLMAGSGLIVNFLNYLFNVFVVRLLGPNNYGVFAALVSLLTVVSVPGTALTTTVTRFVAVYKGRGENQKIRFFFTRLLVVLTFGGLLSSVIFITLSKSVGGYLKITDLTPVILVSLSLAVVFPQTATLGVLQGLQFFSFLSANSIFSALVKLFFGLGLVKLGLAVVGAISGFVLALLFPLLSSLIVLRKYLGGAEEKIDWRSVLGYLPPAALSILGVTMLTTSDIILVKHFFGAFEAGIYSSLSLVGRVIVFASSSVPVVMFSLVAEKQASTERYRHYLFYSLFVVGLLSSAITVFYFLLPDFSIAFFFGRRFLSAAPFLGWFGVFITFYSLANVLVNYFLSINKPYVSVLALLAALSQWFLISFFHGSFRSVINVSIAVTALLTLVLLLYFLSDDDFRDHPRLQTGRND